MRRETKYDFDIDELMVIHHALNYYVEKVKVASEILHTDYGQPFGTTLREAERLFDKVSKEIKG